MSATVLVVDDEETARSFVCGALSDAGYEALEAGDLAQAHQVIETGSADIVRLDVMLPDGSGLSLLDRIELENPSPPVILITPYGEVDTAVQAMKRGALDYLQKPLDLEQMLSDVQRGGRTGGGGRAVSPGGPGAAASWPAPRCPPRHRR